MPHIHTQPGEHDHTASAFIVRTDFDEPKVMLHLHKKLGKYLQFGGHIETTETPWEAVTHEILEESGYEMPQLTLLQPKDRIKPMGSGKTHPIPIYHHTHNFSEDHLHIDVSYPFITDQEPSRPVGKDESGKIRLFTRAEIDNLPGDSTIASVREAALYVFDVCLPKWEKIDPAEFN
jgi:8-oxo-dGTP pyrophosphatase MutT (NUDIX family)